MNEFEQYAHLSIKELKRFQEKMLSEIDQKLSVIPMKNYKEFVPLFIRKSKIWYEFNHLIRMASHRKESYSQS